MSDYAKNILRFIVLVLVQVLILNNINFGGYINPFLYVYFILLLPFETPGWLLLLLAFALGLTIDAFNHTPGMHAAATLLMAFFRPLAIRSISSRTEYEPGISPSIRDMGFRWFLSYAFLLVLIHHVALFYLEVFRLTGFFSTMKRVLYSLVFTLILIILSEYMFTRRRK